MGDDARLPCSWQDYPRDAHGCLPIKALLTADNCIIGPGVCFSLEAAPMDNHGHPVPSDDPKYATCIHDADLPGSKAAVPRNKKRNKMNDAPETAATIVPEAQDPHETVALTEVPGLPLNATEDIKALMPKDGSGGSMVTVALAVVAVGGGGAAWKFYQNFAKQKHEQRMKELELQAESQQNKKDDSHEKCTAERLALELKVSSLETRLASAEKAMTEAAQAKGGDIELPFDADELQERLAKLEKLMTPEKKKPGRPKKSVN